MARKFFVLIICVIGLGLTSACSKSLLPPEVQTEGSMVESEMAAGMTESEAASDSLVLQHTHWQLLNAFEELSPQQMVNGLGQPELQSELDKADQIGKFTVRHVGFVLSLGGGVMPLHKTGFGLISGSASSAETTEECNHDCTKNNDTYHHFEGRAAFEKLYERSKICRKC